MQIWIFLLFKWQLNIAANAITTIFKCASVCCFHYSRSTTGNSSKSGICYPLSKFPGSLIIFMAFFEPRRSKYGNTGPYVMQLSYCRNHLPKYFKCKHQFFCSAFWSIQVFFHSVGYNFRWLCHCLKIGNY